MNKVATVTLSFWIAKICATTLGETAGDLLSMTLGLGYSLSSAILLAGFSLALGAQLVAQRFHPALYWLVIVFTSTVGTTLSDLLDRTLGLGYLRGTVLLISLLIAVLVLWRSAEGTLSVNRIETRRSETFYWLAILVSNTLGTALGDFLADSSGLGFLGGALLIGVLIATTAGVYRWTGISRVALFWIAFVLTRPFGATFGDLLTKPTAKGGLALGTTGSSLVLGAILIVMVADSVRRQADTLGEAAGT